MCCDWDFRTFNFAVHLNGLTDKLRSLHWFVACGFGLFFSMLWVARFVEPEIGDLFLPFLYGFCFLGLHQDLRHLIIIMRINLDPTTHLTGIFCLMDQIPERRRSSWEVQAGRLLLISDPPGSWQHNLQALDHIDLDQLV
jgi:hypothetical protein